MDLNERVQALLQECSAMTLATSGPDGLWAADVFFAPDGLSRLLFISNPDSRHGRNLVASPAAAATVHVEVGANWRAIRGLQMSGEAALVNGDGLATAEAAYFSKFPFAAAMLKPNSAVAARTASTRFYELRVGRLYLVDNSLGFGNRQAIELRFG